MTFRNDIQGLRGVSVLLVVLFHAELPVTGGFVGVDVFFAISGFVIAGVLLRELDSSDTLDLRRFYARRVRRLLPALAVLLVVVTLASIFLLSPFFPQPVALETGLWASLSAGNIYLWLFGGGYFGAGDESNPLVHTWSLGVEEQFYLVFPVIVLVGWRLGARRFTDPRRGLVVVLGVVSLVSFAISVVFTHDVGGVTSAVPAGERLAFYSPFGRAWEFAAGVMLALVMERRRSIGPAFVGWVGLIGLVAISLVFDAATPFPGLASVLPVACAVALMANGSAGVRRILESGPLVWLGDLSYSWYLWHWPFVVFAGVVAPENHVLVVVAAVASLGPSVLSYRFVESRLRARSDTPNRTSIKVAAVAIGTPLLLVVGASAAASGDWGLDDQRVRGSSPVNQSRCHEFAASIEDCRFPAPDGNGSTVLLIGDSHSGVISGPVIEAAHARGYDVVSRNVSACPFTLMRDWFTTGCVAHNERLLEFAREIEPEIVVVANRSERYLVQLDLGSPAVTDDVDEVPSAGAIDRWSDGLERAMTELATTTDRIVVFATVPSFSAEQFDASLPSLYRPDGSNPTRSAVELRELRGPWLAAEAAVFADLDASVVVLDVFDRLCDSTCSIRNDDGSYRYRDPDHLTDGTALTFLDLFESAFDGG